MIPKDWSEINIKQFVQLYPTFDTKDMTDSEIIDNKVKQLTIIKGISEDEAKHCTITEANKVKLLLEVPLPKKIAKTFRLKDIVYQFNIDANRLDCSGYVGSMNAIKEDPINNMHVSLFNLATPVKYSWLRAKWIPYEFKNHEVGDRLKEFLDMPVSVAYPIAVFFLSLSKDLINGSQDYLKTSLEKMNKALSETKEDLVDTAGQ